MGVGVNSPSTKRSAPTVRFTRFSRVVRRLTVQLDLAEIKEHLGIPPRDATTADELRDLETVKSGARD